MRLPKGASIHTGNISYTGEDVVIKSKLQMEKCKASHTTAIQIDETFQNYMKNVLSLRETNFQLAKLRGTSITENMIQYNFDPKSFFNQETVSIAGLIVSLIGVF